MAADGTPGCWGSLQHRVRGAATEGWWVQGQTHRLPMLGVGGHTDVSRAGAHPSPQNVGTAWGEMDGHPPGQLYSPAQALAVPCALWQPRGCLDTPTHQLDTGGVAVPALGTLLQHVGGSWLQREHHSGGWGDPLCPLQPTPLPALTGGRLTSQYACSWQSMTMRSPLRRCLAALAVQRQRGGAGTLPARHPGVLHPGRSPGRSGARTHRSCSRACITTKSQVWLILLCRRL